MDLPNDDALHDERDLSATGRRWRRRDASGHVAPASLDGTTRMQSLIAHLRGCPPEERDALLDHRLSVHMPDPSTLVDMDAAVRRLADAVDAGEDVLLFGDYDVDGATSVAIVQRYLRDAGHAALRTVIPDRDSGYGFGEAALADAMSQMPDLVVLLDCGTQNHATIAAARANGVSVVVLDHHKPASGALPAADALVNPHRADQTAPGDAMRILCTAGLAFMLVTALNRELRARGRWTGRDEPHLPSLLDLVALGTVCDIMPLVGLNRAFVANGLRRLELRRNAGLVALADVAGVRQGASVGSFGFHLGPRINAGGRVGTARLGADLLSSDDPSYCEGVARTLNDCNQERQSVERRVQAEADALVDPTAPVVVVWGRGWHEGVIGIVAGRLKERLDRPVVVMTIREDGIVKGSGRSIPGVDLGATVMDARNAGLLSAGGGHAMACGLTTDEPRIEAFRDFLVAALAEPVAAAIDGASTPYDAPMRTSDLTMGLHGEMERMGPYGQGWPRPRFLLGPVRPERIRETAGGHVFFEAIDDNGRIKAKCWRAGETGLLEAVSSPGPMLLLGHLEVDAFRGVEEIGFIVEDVMRPGTRRAGTRAIAN